MTSIRLSLPRFEQLTTFSLFKPASARKEHGVESAGCVLTVKEKTAEVNNTPSVYMRAREILRFLAFREKLIVLILHVLLRNVGIDLGGIDGLVAQQFLDGS